MADSIEEGPYLTGEGHDLASPARAVEPSCFEPRQEPLQLPVRVSSTILEARAPSIRRLYALKWSVIRDWCYARSLDPTSCDVSHVLTFLQVLLINGRAPSTFKVYVPVNRSLEAGQSIGRHNLISL